jgi:hypothetical protein
MTEKALMLVYVNPQPDALAAWSEWYDTIHIPDMLSVPGVKAATRYKLDGAGVQQIGRDGQLTIAAYLTVYTLEGESISAIRADIAMHAGRWKAAGRSFAGNRVVSNTVYQTVS